MAPLRAIKDEAEVEALAKAAAAADRVAAALLKGEIPLVGRSERQVSAEITRRLLEEGNERVNFAIVASGPNSASPHHEPSEREIQRSEPVVCDFGGSLDGYCSDITRTVFTGPPSRDMAKVYGVVAEAQAAGVMSAQVGELCSGVDGASRAVITNAGFGEYFLHRTGHGIGLEEHEDPVYGGRQFDARYCWPRVFSGAGYLHAGPLWRAYRGHCGGHNAWPSPAKPGRPHTDRRRSMMSCPGRGMVSGRLRLRPAKSPRSGDQITRLEG